MWNITVHGCNILNSNTIRVLSKMHVIKRHSLKQYVLNWITNAQNTSCKDDESPSQLFYSLNVMVGKKNGYENWSQTWNGITPVLHLSQKRCNEQDDIMQQFLAHRHKHWQIHYVYNIINVSWIYQCKSTQHVHRAEHWRHYNNVIAGWIHRGGKELLDCEPGGYSK